MHCNNIFVLSGIIDKFNDQQKAINKRETRFVIKKSIKEGNKPEGEFNNNKPLIKDKNNL